MSDCELALLSCIAAVFVLAAAGIEYAASRSRRPWIHYRTRLGVDASLYGHRKDGE